MPLPPGHLFCFRQLRFAIWLLWLFLFSRLDYLDVVWGRAVSCCYAVKPVSYLVPYRWCTQLHSPGICSAEVHSDDNPVRRDLDVVNRIANAIDNRRWC
jgi:hypothetical protein